MHPERFEELWECLTHENAVVRMRAADALEKATRENSACLQSHTIELLSERLDDGTKEVRWHLLALCGRLQLTDHEAVKLMDRLRHYLETDDSRIVRVTALQTAFEISQRHGSFAAEMKELIRCAKRSKVASLQSRAKKLDTQIPRDR